MLSAAWLRLSPFRNGLVAGDVGGEALKGGRGASPESVSDVTLAGRWGSGGRA